MEAMTTEMLISPDEMLELDDDRVLELVDGRLVEKNMGFLASRIAFVLGWYLETYLRQGNRGIVNCEGSFDCFPKSKNTVRKPDVAVILAGRFANGEIPVGHSSIAPDIAVEMISPSERVYDSDRKVSEYLLNGVKEVWSINPELKTIRIKRNNGTSCELDENGILKSDDLLPGFALRVGEIFQ
jgi:Uma2 family endonuclease